jgi:hypothetical protein
MPLSLLATKTLPSRGSGFGNVPIRGIAPIISAPVPETPSADLKRAVRPEECNLS